jgi:hypothetical protein
MDRLAGDTERFGHLRPAEACPHRLFDSGVLQPVSQTAQSHYSRQLVCGIGRFVDF